MNFSLFIAHLGEWSIQIYKKYAFLHTPSPVLPGSEKLVVVYIHFQYAFIQGYKDSLPILLSGTIGMNQIFQFSCINIGRNKANDFIM